MAAGLSRAPSQENVSTTLSSGITDVAGTMTVADASNIQSPCYLVIDRVDSSGTLKSTSLWEYVKVTAKVGNDLTITRAQGGSTGQAHSSGAVVEAVVTAAIFEEYYAALNPEHTATGTHVMGTATVNYIQGIQMALSSIASIPVLVTSSKLFAANVTITNSLNASGASITGLFPSGASGSVLTSQGNATPPVFAASSSGSSDGWTASSDTWTFASASTFTIAGVDRTTTFTKGTRLKFTQTSAKYAVVVASSFSTDTTVTIAVNTDYTIANAAITSPYYSYEASPQGYPDWFSFTTTWGGFSANPANAAIKYRIIGKTIQFYMVDGASGTSNGTTITFTLPVAAASTQSNAGLVFVADNGSNVAQPTHIGTTATSATITAYKSFFQGNFTSSGGKNIFIPTLTLEY